MAVVGYSGVIRWGIGDRGGKRKEGGGIGKGSCWICSGIKVRRMRRESGIEAGRVRNKDRNSGREEGERRRLNCVAQSKCSKCYYYRNTSVNAQDALSLFQSRLDSDI